MQKMRKEVVLVTVLLCSACATGGPNEEAGMMIGGVLGGLLGAQVSQGDRDLRNIAIIAGTLAGSAIGGSVGRSMDETDRLRTGQTLETVRTGVSSSWRNPDSGVAYRVTPTKTFHSKIGPCREYSMAALIGGREEEVVGTACRQADGSWRVQG